MDERKDIRPTTEMRGFLLDLLEEAEEKALQRCSKKYQRCDIYKSLECGVWIGDSRWAF